MRYYDLVEDLQTSTLGIKNILQSLLLSLSSSGIYDIPINSVIEELQNKTSQAMPVDTLTQLLQSIPIVTSVDEQEVHLKNPAESQEDSSADKVEQMANSGDYSSPDMSGSGAQ